MIVGEISYLKWMATILLFSVVIVGCDNSGNSKPVALSRTVTLSQNVSTDLLLGGSDADGDQLTVIIVTGPLHGDIKDGVYTPDVDFLGVDELTYKVTDGKLDSELVEVKLTVVDVTRPTINIISKNTQKITETTAEALFEIVVSENVTELKVEDILVTAGEIKSFSGSNRQYLLVVAPDKNSASPILVEVSQNVIHDESGNKNIQSNLASRAVDTQLPFVTIWKTDNIGKSNNNQIILKGAGVGYDFNIDWGDGKSQYSTSNTVGHTYGEPGVYTVRIKGDYPRITFANIGKENDAQKLLEIKQWGTIQWENMSGAFNGCKNMSGSFIDEPDLSLVSDMSYMFANTNQFNSEIGGWNVSKISHMEGIFYNAKVFNKPIDEWNTENVKTMTLMFSNTERFDKNLENWDTSKVTSFASMFKGAKRFNKKIATWSTSQAKNMSSMFYGAVSFKQNLNAWDTSNVRSMDGMFKGAIRFNGDITEWNLSNVTSTKFMFEGAASFNQNIAVWNTENVNSMLDMFKSAKRFNQDLSVWNVSSVKKMGDMFFKSAMSKDNLIKVNALWPLLETKVPN